MYRKMTIPSIGFALDHACHNAHTILLLSTSTVQTLDTNVYSTNIFAFHSIRYVLFVGIKPSHVCDYILDQNDSQYYFTTINGVLMFQYCKYCLLLALFCRTKKSYFRKTTESTLPLTVCFSFQGMGEQCVFVSENALGLVLNQLFMQLFMQFMQLVSELTITQLQ